MNDKRGETMADQVSKEVAEGLWKLAKAVELLARENGNSQAEQWARSAKRAGNSNR